MKQELPELPLWMPSGSIRAILALVIVIAFTAMCIMLGHVEALGLIAVMVVKDYFEMRKKDIEKTK